MVRSNMRRIGVTCQYIASFWSDLSINKKFTISFFIFLLITLTVSMTTMAIMRSAQRHVEAIIDSSLEIQRLVLSMNSGLQGAVLTKRSFFHSWPIVGFELAHDTYVDECFTQLEDVRNMSSKLREFISRPEAGEALQKQVVDLTFFLSAAEHCARSFENAVSLVILVAGDHGLHHRLNKAAQTALSLIQKQDDQSILALYHQMLSSEKEYFLSRKRPFMQSAINQAGRIQELAESNGYPYSINQALEKYKKLAIKLLDLENQIRSKQNEFDLQVEAVAPIAERLALLAEEEVTRSRSILQSTQSKVFFFIVVSLATGFVIAFSMAILLKRTVTDRILSLSTTVQTLQKGDYSTKAKVQSRDELGQLAQGINDMSEQIRKHSEELTSHAQDLMQANERLLRIDEMKSSFMTMVSHDIRTPLTSMIGFTKICRRDFLKTFLPPTGHAKRKKGDRILQNINIIYEEGQRLAQLLTDFLDLSKLEAGRFQWRDTPTDLNKVVARAAQSVQGVLEEREDLHLEMEIPKDLPYFMVDQERLIQVLVNILQNAIKFTSSGVIKISIACQQGMVCFSVSDTGIGIPENEIDYIFDKFHQLHDGDTLLTPEKGSGLGLNICKNIVEHYDGDIWVESNFGEGSTFFITLPLCPVTA